jgi:hypothetical protein
LYLYPAFPEVPEHCGGVRMKALFLKLIFLIWVLGVATDAAAQVRVRRGRGIPDPKPPRKEKVRKKVQKRVGSKPVSVGIKPTRRQAAATDLDPLFYVKWKNGQDLQYADFLYNRNLYNKFLPTRDTDLVKVIYPDYRDFYTRLSERMRAGNGVYDEYWLEKLEQVTRERPDTGIYAAVKLDSAMSFTITIDSPAASVINITPIIYPLNETAFYFNITALFSKNDSWMIIKSKDILFHEQIHFDIFELFARKMRKHLVETIMSGFTGDSPADIAREITPVYEQLYQQLNDMQYEFDRQTGALTSANASLSALNLKWKKTLLDQIDALKDYAIPEGTIVLH